MRDHMFVWREFTKWRTALAYIDENMCVIVLTGKVTMNGQPGEQNDGKHCRADS
jgi:hypothetical protein